MTINEIVAFALLMVLIYAIVGGAGFIGYLFNTHVRNFIEWLFSIGKHSYTINNIHIIAHNHGIKRKPFESGKKFRERVFNHIHERG